MTPAADLPPQPVPAEEPAAAAQADAAVEEWSSHVDTPTTRQLFSESFLRDCANKCSSNPQLLAIVISAPSHVRERDAIRKGWGRSENLSLCQFSILSK